MSELQKALAGEVTSRGACSREHFTFLAAGAGIVLTTLSPPPKVQRLS